jgi:hypothetical protein
LAGLLVLVPSISIVLMVTMPGSSHHGKPPALSPAHGETRARLVASVRALASDSGERNDRRPQALTKAAEYLEQQLGTYGYEAHRQSHEYDGHVVFNIEAVLPGSRPGAPCIVVGGH